MNNNKNKQIFALRIDIHSLDKCEYRGFMRRFAEFDRNIIPLQNAFHIY